MLYCVDIKQSNTKLGPYGLDCNIKVADSIQFCFTSRDIIILFPFASINIVIFDM